MYLKVTVTVNFILELFLIPKKETHIWVTYISVDTTNGMISSLSQSQSCYIHIVHLGGGFTLQVLILRFLKGACITSAHFSTGHDMRLAHPPGQNYFMSFL